MDLLTAIKNNDLEGVKKYLPDADREEINLAFRHSGSMDLEILRLLLTQPGDLRIGLRFAVRAGNEEAVKLFLEAGAEPDREIPYARNSEILRLLIGDRLRPGTQLGGLTIVQELGIGGYGQVFKVMDAEGKISVLKVLFRPDQRQIEAAAQEFYLVRQLQSKYIIKYLKLEACQYLGMGTLCLQMEYFEGIDLFTYVERLVNLNSELSPETENEINIIIEQLFEALEYLHSQRVVHGDIKLDNILWNGEQILLIDFGLSCYQDRCQLQVGTLDYLAPEQILPIEFHYNPADSRPRDIWAAGIVIYDLVSQGINPFDSENFLRSIVRDGIPWRYIPENYQEILQRILIKDARLRPTAHQVLKMLE